MLASLAFASLTLAQGPDGSAGGNTPLACAGVSQVPLAECQALETFYASTNGAQWYDKGGWTVNKTPCSWYGVACQAGHVSQLTLGDNNLTGMLPAALGNLSQLTSLTLARNDITGPVPATLAGLSQLQTLDLSENQLNGVIPTQLGNLTALQTLSLANNQFTGGIPVQFGSLPALRMLDLGSNRLTGPIPPALGGLSNLQLLFLNDNQLSGEIPPEMGNVASLQRLVLSNNALTGPIPTALANLNSLSYLILGRNQLTGPLPVQLTTLPTLHFLMVNNNRLTGSIPSELGHMTSLLEVWLNSNAFAGPAPDSICNLPNLFFIDVGYNAVTTGPSCLTFLDPKWRTTQTVAPTGLAASPGSNQVRLSWTPILYQVDAGAYEISYRTPGGAWMVHGSTADKSAASYTVTGLNPNTSYEFRIRTTTAAHNDPPAYQQNALWSEYVAIAAATTAASAPRPVFLPLILKR